MHYSKLLTSLTDYLLVFTKDKGREFTFPFIVGFVVTMFYYMTNIGMFVFYTIFHYRLLTRFSLPYSMCRIFHHSRHATQRNPPYDSSLQSWSRIWRDSFDLLRNQTWSLVSQTQLDGPRTKLTYGIGNGH
jgi:hypothetical protein